MAVDEKKRVRAIFTDILGTHHTLRSIVSWHFSTIQDAINAAVNTDTIIVRPGTYALA